jgi:hypothetical protein
LKNQKQKMKAPKRLAVDDGSVVDATTVVVLKNPPIHGESHLVSQIPSLATWA